MKRFILLTVIALAAFGIGGPSGSAAPLTAADQLYGFERDDGLLQPVDNKKKKKKRKTGANILGAPAYWGYGPIGPNNPCKKCAQRCDENPDSARCRRCRARCE